MKPHIINCLAILALAGFSAGCVPKIPLQDGASDVKIGIASPPAGCRLLGSISSEVVNGWAGYMSPREMLHNGMDELKNSTTRLGGNYAQITKHTVIYGKHAGGTITMVDMHRMLGNAYGCNPNAYRQIPVDAYSQISAFTGDK